MSNNCVGKLSGAFEGHTVKEFIRFKCRSCLSRCNNQASGLEGSCWRE